MFKKNNKVNKVVHLKFIFRLDQIAKWVENNFNENLLDNISFDNKDNLLYKIDLLPHPNGMDSLFYHRYSNAFSSYLDAFETRGEYFRKFSDKVCGIEWTLREGYLLFFVLLSNEYKEARKLLLIAPTDEILLMQIYGEAQSDRLLDEGIVNISYFKGKTEKVKKEALGFCGGGVRYSNNLCQVDIYPSKLMDYNREK